MKVIYDFEFFVYVRRIYFLLFKILLIMMKILKNNMMNIFIILFFGNVINIVRFLFK